MSSWSLVRSLFLAALEVPVSEREAWLIAECGEDQELRRRVEELLDADESTGDGRLPLAGDVPRRVLQNELMTSLLGSRVASYQLRSVLGAGGMGTVFLAEQSHPKRTVALKMLSTGLSDEQARRRFEYESEVLGRLQHPAIAQVYEAGTWQDDVSGQDVPWFAMELVRNARPVTEFISKKRLDLTNTLNTFLEICDGVYHGHGLGVIHRDLKPANILVGSDEQPKIIDFGIAKTTQTGTKETQHTAAGQIFGTLQYMSPEQMAAAPGDLDIRTDVYALGVLLYELLTGRPPHDPTDTPVHVFAQKVRDTEPVRPSQVRDVRGRPGPSGLPQDLDWVVLKAMAKDREERYGSVSELAADVRRFLANEPVLAGPPGGIYRLRKLLRRQRVVVSAGVLILISILVGAGMTYREYRRATKAERQAKTNEHTAKHQATLAQQKTAEAQQLLQRANAEVAAQQDLVDFFQEIFDQARTVKKGKDVRVVDLLDSSSPHVDRDLGDQPRSAITIHATIGQTYLSLGHPKKARRHFESAVALADTHLEKHHSHRLWALRGLGMSLTLLEDETEYAERLLREALRLADQPADVDTDEPSIKKRRIDKMHSRMALTNLLLRCNRNEEAVREARLVASASRELYGDVEITANSLLVRALIRVPEHKPEGFKLADSNWRRAQSDLGPRHHVTLRQQALAAQCLAAQGQADESIRLMQSFLVAAPDALGNEHVETLVVRRLLALALARRNRHDEATEQWKLLVQHGAKTSVVSQHFADRHGLATSYAKAGRWSDAYAVYQAADKDLEDVVINPTLAAVIQYYYATHLIEHKRYADAEKRLLSALDKMKQTMPKGHFWFPRIHKKLVLLYQRWGKPEKAKEWKSKLR